MPNAICMKCRLKMPWRKGHKPPDKCPACGYDGSKVDLSQMQANTENRLRTMRMAKRIELPSMPTFREAVRAMSSLELAEAIVELNTGEGPK